MRTYVNECDLNAEDSRLFRYGIRSCVSVYMCVCEWAECGFKGG